MFYPDICDRYTAILLKQPADATETGASHLLWMLSEIQATNTMSETKRHRWLGYIQGVMVMKGLITVDEERSFTRRIFNGD